MAVGEIITDFFNRKYGLDRTGNVIIKGGVPQPDAAGAVVSLTGNTTLTQAAHAGMGRVVLLNASAGLTVTLPAATGSGATYRIMLGTALASNNYKVQVASSSDYMRGKAWLGASANSEFTTANTGTVATESDTITLNGGTTGGLVGDYIDLTDAKANVWAVECSLAGSGTAATPFSVAV